MASNNQNNHVLNNNRLVGESQNGGWNGASNGGRASVISPINNRNGVSTPVNTQCNENLQPNAAPPFASYAPTNPQPQQPFGIGMTNPNATASLFQSLMATGMSFEQALQAVLALQQPSQTTHKTVLPCFFVSETRFCRLPTEK